MTAAARARIVATARSWIGTPYRHQASVRGAGADCLGLVRGIWREVVGPEVEVAPAYSFDWGETGRREVLFEAARRNLREVALPGHAGDVVLFRMREKGIAKHLGVLTEGGARFVHAFTGHGVVENTLSDPWRRRIVAVFEFPIERI
ncbi:MAG: NlpC/P60 family protein [Pseudomonadota bacterium]